jgi:endonuclease/exonuclease/phosphatase family metal-dependent hydrolase
VPLVVRTWNVFHGNAVPPERHAFLEQMVRLVAADGPDVVCLQEVPVWALAHLEEWSGMAAAPAVARPPRLGPVPWPAEAGRVVTDLDHGLLRSAFTGQANAILVARRHRILDTETIALNERAFRRAQARWLRLDLVTRLAWAKERRACQVARIAVGGGDATLLVANLHTTSYEADQRIADAELRRASAFVEGLARPAEPVILCGDMNLFPERSRTIQDLRAEGFSEPVPQRIDQVLVRGLSASPPVIWPEERRRVDGRLLSDHAPVEVVVG